jgi:hypothetical protein
VPYLNEFDHSVHAHRQTEDVKSANMAIISAGRT